MDGQLGNNSTTDSAVPVDVTGLTSGVAAVSANTRFTCALTSAGGVKCWGSDDGGVLGDNSTRRSPVPVDVVGLSSGVVAISAGNGHTCVINGDGGVLCWGDNQYGQLGNNSTVDSPIPTRVPTLTSGVVAISAGDGHTCAVTSSGALKCWGFNAEGQLGNNSKTDSLVPMDVPGLTTGVTSVAASAAHTCALLRTGSVKCWGFNLSGQLGDGTMTSHLAPVDVTGLTDNIVQISSLNAHTCALTSAGGVKCWGDNRDGELGNNTETASAVPVDVSGLSSGVASIGAGGSQTCAFTDAGRIKCWGNGVVGSLGNNAMMNSPVPVDVIW